MLKSRFSLSCLVVLLMVLPIVMTGRVSSAPRTQSTVRSDAVPMRGISTLYALDPIARTLCFGDGTPGLDIADHEVVNRASDIDFGGYVPGSFSVGIEGDRVGTVLDLGLPADLEKKYGYAETVGGGQGFASIHRQNNELKILKDTEPTRRYQTMKESEALFQPGTTGADASVKLGHVYLIRLTDRNDKAFERLIKLLVISLKPDESVTIRWEVLK